MPAAAIAIPAAISAGTSIIGGIQGRNAAKDAAAWVGRLKLVAETELDGKMQSVLVLGLTSVRPGIVRRCDGLVGAVLGK